MNGRNLKESAHNEGIFTHLTREARPEIWSMILSEINLADVANVSLSCRFFRDVVSSEYVKKNIKRDYSILAEANSHEELNKLFSGKELNSLTLLNHNTLAVVANSDIYLIQFSLLAKGGYSFTCIGELENTKENTTEQKRVITKISPHLLVATNGNHIEIWDWKRKICIKEFQHIEPVQALTIKENHIMIGSKNSISLYDLTGKLIYQSKHKPCQIKNIKISKNGDYLIENGKGDISLYHKENKCYWSSNQLFNPLNPRLVLAHYLHADGRLILALQDADEEDEPKLYQLFNNELSCFERIPAHFMQSIVALPEEKYMTIHNLEKDAEHYCEIKIIDINSGVINEFEIKSTAFTNPIILPNGDVLAITIHPTEKNQRCLTTFCFPSLALTNEFKQETNPSAASNRQGP